MDVGLAAGPGLTSGIGTPDFRVVASLGFGHEFREKPPPDRDGDGIFDAQDACPDQKGEASSEPAKNGCPPDRDGDGVVDAKDACVDLPGVAAEDPAKNGCPPDRDGDGIVDSQDACIDVKGAASSQPTKNGCPPDRDGDGILDPQDSCVDVPGVASEDPGKNGCPPPPADRDGDGIADAQDACPEVKGVVSTDATQNGCPSDRDGDKIIDTDDACPDEKGGPSPDPKQNGCPTGAVVNNQIVVLDPVRFESGSDQILPASDQVLQTILATIRKLPETNRYRLEGHTDNKGSAAKNRDLSLARAKAVVAWMVAHGIDASRFDVAGFGPDKPITSNSS